MTNATDDDLLHLRASARAQLAAHQDMHALWRSFAATGLATLLFEDGAGVPDPVALASVAQEVGYALGDAPFTASAAGVGHLAALLAPTPEVETLRAELRAGAIATLAVPHTLQFGEPAEATFAVSSSASAARGLTGRVCSVMSAADADVFLVLLQCDDAPQLAAVRRGPGVYIELDKTVDPTRRPASVTFDEAALDLLAVGPVVEDQVRQALMVETLSVAAEMVGAARAALDEITQFVRGRKAFGQPVGAFQAVRHRCADRLVDIAVAEALVMEAGHLMEQPHAASGDADVALALAKTAATTALHAVAQESVLLRGAYGFTWDGGGHRFIRRWMVDSSYRGRSSQLARILDDALVNGAIHPSLDDEFTISAHAWITANAPSFVDPVDAYGYFPDLTAQQIADRLRRARAWERCKKDAGWAGVAVPVQYGGRGGTQADATRFAQLEHRQPLPHVQFEITSTVVMPALLQWGDEEQRRRYIPPILSGDELWCQMTSEPDAGSDLAMLGTRATRTADGWEVTGRKIWISGAQFADFGLLLARTDPNAPKHKGVSAFIVPMNTSGVEIQPIRQASGSTHFCEVLLDHVRLPDSALIGRPGDGWKIVIATLAFERLSLSGSGVPFGPIFDLSRDLDALSSPEQAAGLRDLLVTMRGLDALTRQSLVRAESGGTPGSETSINKLLTGRAASQSADVVESMLGPGLAARPEWAQFVLGSVGLRIGGGTEEIQRDVLADRVLQLPTVPRSDRMTPWSQIART